MDNNKFIQAEVEAAIKSLKTLPKELEKKTKRKILREAAKPLITAARANVPVSDQPHHRYKNGRKVATYFPHNLRKSIQTLVFRRTKDLFVGPRLAKRAKTGDFGKGRRIDGYYAHWVEYGTRFFTGAGYMRRAVDSSTSAVHKKIIEGVTEVITNWIRKRRITNID